jgi:RND superfamily putative drug exporter
MARSLDRLGRYCVRHRRGIFEIWFVLVLCFGYLGAAHGGLFVQQPRLPGTETQRSIDMMQRDFPQMTGPTATVVFRAGEGVRLTDWRVALNVGQAIDNVAKLDRVAFVENPYAPGMGGLKNGRAAVAYVHFKGTMRDVTSADLTKLEAATEQARKAGVDVRMGGIVSMLLNQPKSGPAEGAGVFLALLVLLLAFGSFLAAGIPIIVSLCGLAIAYSFIHFGASLTDVHPIAPLVAAMLGLGAGIDYALFIVTRHRQQLGEPRRSAGPAVEVGGAGWSGKNGRGDTDEVETAVGKALGTSGHAVVFAGGTVVFAICGLWLSGIAFVGRIGLATAIAVAVMVCAALTLLPAVLGALGTRIDRFRLPLVRPDRSSARWSRWGHHVDRHAWPYALGATVVLAALAIPALSLQFGVMADSTMPKSNQARQAYDIVAKEFGPGYYSPFVVVAKTPSPPAKPAKKKAASQAVPTYSGVKGLSGVTGPSSGAAAWRQPGQQPRQSARTQAARGLPGLPAASAKASAQAERMAKELRVRLSKAPGVKAVGKPVVSRDTALLQVVPAAGPHDQATTDLVHRLRGSEIPAVARHHPGATVYLGGETPAIIDLADLVQQRMRIVVAAVVGVALLLLVVAFRSILVPIKAALMNLVSIGASYGLVVAVFQWGWGIHLIGLDGPIPIVSFVPLFMFATIFGLSMDYEVFLLSRIKEEYDHTGDPHGSIVTGIGSTARLITSAALIMIFVFLSFLPQPDATTKMMSLGLTAAVAVDATIVRLVLVPALMSLLGHANWWFPGRRSRPKPSRAGEEEVDGSEKERELEPSPS